MNIEELTKKRILKGYISEECEKIAFPELAGVLVCKWMGVNSKPCAAVYSGRKVKPVFCFSFNSEEQRENKINTFLNNEKVRQEEKKKYQENKSNYQHKYKVGDILYSSWGYDQTNIDFYQVVNVPSKKSVKVRQLKEHREEDGHDMSGETIPLINQFYGEEMLRRVSLGGVVKISECERATEWDGKPKYYTSYH